MDESLRTIGKELDLKREQERTLSTPRLKTNLILKIMIRMLDVLYGTGLTLPKVLVLEILARYPYWAWETGGYSILSKLYCSTDIPSAEKVEGIMRHIELGRTLQDKEQLHMLLVADLISQKGIKLGWFRHFLMPRVMAFKYFFLTKIIYHIKPEWSFAMNAAFESHAEREYMLLVKDHPEWEEEGFDSVYFKYYPREDTVADLLRRIALDERDHMNESLDEVRRLKQPQ